MTLEEKYWHYYNRQKESWENFRARPTIENENKWQEETMTFSELCTLILVQLMEENSDVLKRLKEKEED